MFPTVRGMPSCVGVGGSLCRENAITASNLGVAATMLTTYSPLPTILHSAARGKHRCNFGAADGPESMTNRDAVIYRIAWGSPSLDLYPHLLFTLGNSG